jgi:dTDP-glucose 4,6-dehydratase
MRILVTGGAGFIGSNFIHYILNKYQNYKIINLDKLTYCGNIENLQGVANNPNYRFIKADICDYKIVYRIVKECEVIINFAAESSVDKSIVDAADFIKTNFWGVYVLLKAAKKHKAKLLQISTDEVYGSIERGFAKETSNLYPNSPYAASKASADLLMRSYYITYKFPVIIIRICNNFGPYQYPEKIIPLFITNILQNKRVSLYGNGLNIRDWIFVLDTCSAIDSVLHKGQSGQIYNVGARNQMCNLELTRLIIKKLGKSEKLIKYVEDRPGHDRRYALDYTKIKQLGWQPKFNFEEALDLTLSWYKKNIKWWEKLKI